MVISELIESLQEILNKWGDMRVAIDMTYAEGPEAENRDIEMVVGWPDPEEGPVLGDIFHMSKNNVCVISPAYPEHDEESIYRDREEN